MEGYRLRSAHGDTIDPRQPLPVDSVEAQAVESVSPTITYNGKAAAGAVSINSLTYKPIISAAGDQVASYWGEDQNRVYEALNQTDKKKGAHWLTSFTETATSAAFVIYDPDHNLENMFESVTGTVKRFIARATDTTGHVLYGWIRGVSVSGNFYTFEVFNARSAETAQSWVGNTTNFVQTAVEKIEIFHYNSSVSFGTGTTFTEEVECPKEYSKNWENPLVYANSLSNGQFFVDYMRARYVGKKADTTASEVVTYNIWSSTTGTTGGAAGSVTVTSIVPGTGATNLGKAEDAAHTSGDVGVLGLTVRKDTAASTAGTDGDYAGLITNSTGHLHNAEGFAAKAEDDTNNVFAIQDKPLNSATYNGTKVQNNSFTTTNVKASAGKLLYVCVTNTTASARWFQIHNTATTPAGGATATHKFLVAANSQTILEAKNLGYNGAYLATGIAIANSTVAATYTAGGAGDLLVELEYI